MGGKKKENENAVIQIILQSFEKRVINSVISLSLPTSMVVTEVQHN